MSLGSTSPSARKGLVSSHSIFSESALKKATQMMQEWYTRTANWVSFMTAKYWRWQLGHCSLHGIGFRLTEFPWHRNLCRERALGGGKRGVQWIRTNGFIQSWIAYRGTGLWLWADFSAETLQARRQWENIFKVLKEKAANQENYIWPNRPLKLIKGEMNTFLDKRKLKAVHRH